MANPVGIRRFTRINCKQDVQLDFGTNKYDQTVCNLSMGGLCVTGEFEQQTGDYCEIELRPTGTGGPAVDFQAKGKVVWVGSGSMAVEFTEMEYDSFLFLQTTLLYQADDPLLVSTEFVKDVTFQVVDEGA